MKLKSLFGPEKTRKSKVQSREDLGSLFREGIDLGAKYTEKLTHQAEAGSAYFTKVNETRMQLAFESFDKDMKKALFEIIYLLHVNESFLAEHEYVKRTLKGKSIYREEARQVDLYVPNAPCGVQGIDSLSDIFKEDFEDYIFSAFGKNIPSEMSYYELPVNGVYSIGSIGTVGHKNIASDLDLEVQYEFEPSVFNTKGWNDEVFSNALRKELFVLIKAYYHKKGIKGGKLETFPKIKESTVFFKKRIQKKYPFLYRYLIEGDTALVRKINAANSVKAKMRVIHEIMNLMENQFKLNNAKLIKRKEALLKKRILLIQNYIQDKFPAVEVYLFPFSLKNFRKGYFGSTLESKESSGGAYELILNYDTLMPGIYFTPVIPTHFLMPDSVNNREERFNKVTDVIRFNLSDIYERFKGRHSNQGPTPDLAPEYVANHYSAVYWEAFKASYGNLPKAMLNLLRYECLLEPKLGKTIIQLVKQTNVLDHLAFSKENIEKRFRREKVFSPQALIKFESAYPKLQIDPWWLRYKALKIAFGVPGLVPGIEVDDLTQINRVIDLAFALHIRLSDVFHRLKSQKNKGPHREIVLTEYLNVVFPPESQFRNRLYAIFIGDVETVNEFEQDLRLIFKNSIERVHLKINKLDIRKSDKQSKEAEIWHHYYKKNFMPQPNVIQRSILNHLQVPRGRLKIGYVQNEGWFFNSLQKGSSIGKRFQSSVLNMLPDQITLIKGTGFLYGLVYCVVNRYYGIFDKNTLKETRTAIEYDRKFSNIGSGLDNKYAYVRPNQIDHIMELVSDLMHPIKLSYLDCIHKEKEVISVIVFFNLLKCGNISILYRDNLDTLYVSSCHIKAVGENFEKFYSDYKRFFRLEVIHRFILAFFLKQNIDPNRVDLKVWVNINSFQTKHAMSNQETKATELSELMKKIITASYNKTVHPKEEF